MTPGGHTHMSDMNTAGRAASYTVATLVAGMRRQPVEAGHVVRITVHMNRVTHGLAKT